MYRDQSTMTSDTRLRLIVYAVCESQWYGPEFNKSATCQEGEQVILEIVECCHCSWIWVRRVS